MFNSFRKLVVGSVCMLCIFLASCANLDRKVENVSVKSQIKEPVSSLLLVFLNPPHTQDSQLMTGYTVSGVTTPSLMMRAGNRVVDFFKENGLNAETASPRPFDASPSLRPSLVEWSKKGFNAMVFIPVGASVTSQGHTAISASVRYRVTLYDRKLSPMIEFYDSFHPAAFNSNFIDTSAAGWLSALTDHGYVSRKPGKYKQPPFRDFVKEDREARLTK